MHVFPFLCFPSACNQQRENLHPNPLLLLTRLMEHCDTVVVTTSLHSYNKPLLLFSNLFIIVFFTPLPIPALHNWNFHNNKLARQIFYSFLRLTSGIHKSQIISPLIIGTIPWHFTTSVSYQTINKLTYITIKFLYLQKLFHENDNENIYCHHTHQEFF